MRDFSRSHYLVCLAFVVILCGCTSSAPPRPTPTPSPTPVPRAAGCPGGNLGPSLRYGSRNLTPTFGTINTSPVVPKTLYVTINGASDIQLDAGGPMIGDVFEICVVTNPPARNTHLGVDVTSVLEDPSPSAGPGGPVNFWQNVFATFFVRPLQDNQIDANGVLKLDVSAQSLRNAIINPPTGYSSGRMLITVILSDGPHKLDLTIAPR
jgi:hypothetical protein